MFSWKVGDKILFNCDHWFFCPDGKQYRAVWGTLKGIYSSEDTLGVRTNAKSTNWYVQVGDVLIAGCQIHYAVKTDFVCTEGFEEAELNNDKTHVNMVKYPNRIYVTN